MQPASTKTNATAVPPRTIEHFVISFLLYKFPSRKLRIGQPTNRQSPAIRKPYSNSGAGAWVIRMSLVERSLLSRGAGGTRHSALRVTRRTGRDSESPERCAIVPRPGNPRHLGRRHQACGTAACRSLIGCVSGPLGSPQLNSLHAGFNSVFGRLNSLFDGFNSLFGRLGNLPSAQLKKQ